MVNIDDALLQKLQQNHKDGEPPVFDLAQLQAAGAIDPKSIVARPTLLIDDGQMGVVTIGEQIPFIKGYHDDPTKGRVADIDYQLAGLKLNLRATLVAPADPGPHTVKLDIDATWTEIIATATAPAPTSGPPIQVPVLERRQAQTTATVGNNSSVVLLLGPTTKGKDRNGKLLILTPHVASAPAP